MTASQQRTNNNNNNERENMNIEALTVADLREIASLIRNLEGGAPHATSAADPYVDLIGENVFIRAVTYHYTGRVVAVTAGEIVLVDASWIASSGRWAGALKSGDLSEVEPFVDGDKVIIGRGAIVDCSPWHHKLPRAQK